MNNGDYLIMENVFKSMSEEETELYNNHDLDFICPLVYFILGFQKKSVSKRTAKQFFQSRSFRC